MPHQCYFFSFPNTSHFWRHLHIMHVSQQAIELDLGQQISLIGSTPEDRVMRAAFIPLSDRLQPGILEIVSEKNNPDDPSVRILDTLAVGETIQVCKKCFFFFLCKRSMRRPTMVILTTSVSYCKLSIISLALITLHRYSID